MCPASRRDSQEERRYPTRTTERFTIVSRNEPTVWSRTMLGPLSDSELLFYDTHGYLALPAFVDRRHVTLLRDAAETIRAKAESDDFDVEHEEDTDAVRSVRGIQRDGHFGALLTHPGIVGAARQILADETYVFDARIDYRVAFEGRGVAFHADFEEWHHERSMPTMRALSVRLFLSAHRACNGPIMVIPGSHRVFIPRASGTGRSGLDTSSREAITALERTHGIDVLTGGPGTVVFADANLLYASGDNPSPIDRVTLFCAFNAVSNTPP